MDPSLTTSYPSAILCRDKALVVNLEHIKVGAGRLLLPLRVGFVLLCWRSTWNTSRCGRTAGRPAALRFASFAGLAWPRLLA